jgi:hypothetical protein
MLVICCYFRMIKMTRFLMGISLVFVYIIHKSNRNTLTTCAFLRGDLRNL